MLASSALLLSHNTVVPTHRHRPRAGYMHNILGTRNCIVVRSVYCVVRHNRILDSIKVLLHRRPSLNFGDGVFAADDAAHSMPFLQHIDDTCIAYSPVCASDLVGVSTSQCKLEEMYLTATSPRSCDMMGKGFTTGVSIGADTLHTSIGTGDLLYLMQRLESVLTALRIQAPDSRGILRIRFPMSFPMGVPTRPRDSPHPSASTMCRHQLLRFVGSLSVDLWMAIRAD